MSVLSYILNSQPSKSEARSGPLSMSFRLTPIGNFPGQSGQKRKGKIQHVTLALWHSYALLGIYLWCEDLSQLPGIHIRGGTEGGRH